MNMEYQAPEDAWETAGRRLRNPALQERVRQYLGGVWPAGFEEINTPTAVFAPYLAKGSETETDFLNKAMNKGFDTAVATYAGTEYVTANPGVVDCYRAPLILPKGQRQRMWVVAEAERAGAVGRANTMYDDMTIVDYWDGIRNVVLEQNKLPADGAVVDFGAWYALQAGRFGWTGERAKSPFYYMASMALYASGRAVLFDTPPTAFATRVMQPAYEAASSELGVEPLITNELQPGKRDWVDVSFLADDEVGRLQSAGKINTPKFGRVR
jgi:hypothetical protein